MRYTDKTDGTTVIALFEQGQIRRPDTGKTLLCLNPSDEHTKDNPPRIVTQVITFDDVQEALEEMPKGYFTFIGSSLEQEIRDLDNNYLTGHILSLNMWTGYFLPDYY